MFGLSTSQWYGNGEVGVEENPQAICVENCGYNDLYLSRFVARVFSLKYSSTFVGNMGIYSVGIENVYQIGQSGKTECFTSIS